MSAAHRPPFFSPGIQQGSRVGAGKQGLGVPTYFVSRPLAATGDKSESERGTLQTCHLLPWQGSPCPRDSAGWRIQGLPCLPPQDCLSTLALPSHTIPRSHPIPAFLRLDTEQRASPVSTWLADWLQLLCCWFLPAQPFSKSL